MTRYEIVWGEVRRAVRDEPVIDWPVILHDHGGTLTHCCIPIVLAELNRLAAERDAAVKENAELRKRLEAKP